MNGEYTPLSALIIADNFDPRFLPVLNNQSWSSLKIGDVAILNHTLSWISRTKVENLVIVVSKVHEESIRHLIECWRGMFDSINLISTRDCLSFGDAMRNVYERGFIKEDFVLIANPATFCSSDLSEQIAKFRERRKDRKAVMTMVYHETNVIQPFIGIDADNMQLKSFYFEERPFNFNLEKRMIVGNFSVHSNLNDTGIAFCASSIISQFSDNFDYHNRDDIVREILANEEILGQHIHVDILSENVTAFRIVDYEDLLLANAFIALNRIPVTHFDITEETNLTAYQNNVRIYGDNDIPKQSRRKFGPNVVFGSNCMISEKTCIHSSSIGSMSKIGDGSEISLSVIGENVKIGSCVKISRAFIGDNVCIEDNVVLEPRCIIACGVNIPPSACVKSGSVLCQGNFHGYDDIFISEQTPWSSELKFADGREIWFLHKFDSVDVYLSSIEEDRISELDDSDVELGLIESFYDEICESLSRVCEKTQVNDEAINTAIVEINSSKLAYNIPVDQVVHCIFLAFLNIHCGMAFQRMKEDAKKLRLLFKNYYTPIGNQLQALTAIEEHLKCSTDSEPLVAKLIHLFYEMDIFVEEAILLWYHTVDNDSIVYRLAAPIVKWLNEAVEESD